MNIKLFDIILHPSLKKRWIHFDVEAKDQNGKEYFHYSSIYGSYTPDYPAFPCSAAKNYFNKKQTWGYKLDPFDFNQLFSRIRSYQWEIGIKSIKFSNQIYVCPKTHIVWQWSKKQVEGTNYFEIEKLPKNEDDFNVCEDQYDDVYRLFKK